MPDGIILHELGIVNLPRGKKDVLPTTVLTPSCKKVTLPLDSNSESEVSDKDADKEGDTNTVCFIKKMGSGASETSLCSFCGNMSNNHYCCAKVPNSNIIIEARGDNEHVCGKAMCILCRNNWGDTEKYMNYCRDHHPDDKDNGEQISNEVEKNKDVGNKRKSQNKKNKEEERCQRCKFIW